jgi:hypothetical protein
MRMNLLPSHASSPFDYSGVSYLLSDTSRLHTDSIAVSAAVVSFVYGHGHSLFVMVSYVVRRHVIGRHNAHAVIVFYESSFLRSDITVSSDGWE